MKRGVDKSSKGKMKNEKTASSSSSKQHSFKKKIYKKKKDLGGKKKPLQSDGNKEPQKKEPPKNDSTKIEPPRKLSSNWQAFLEVIMYWYFPVRHDAIWVFHCSLEHVVNLLSLLAAETFFVLHFHASKYAKEEACCHQKKKFSKGNQSTQINTISK